MKSLQLNDGWAPVADYKGVGLLEKGGNKRAVWKGREYTTDGLVYLWVRGDAEAITTVGVRTERNAKAYIDDLSEDQRKRFYSYKECGRILRMPNIEEITPPSAWDERAGVFVPWDDLTDGQHHTGLKP